MTKKAGFFDQIIGLRVVWLLKFLLMVTFVYENGLFSL